GYPPEDLVRKRALAAHARRAIDALVEDSKAPGMPAIVIGAPIREEEALYNASLVIGGGSIIGHRAKHELPNYGVFDEVRVFDRGPVPGPISLPLAGGGSIRLGVMVCEDMWTPDVSEALAETGAEILIVINGSPYESDKVDTRLNIAVARATEADLPLIYVNQVGGQDELVFDGGSFVLDHDRRLKAQAKWFAEDLLFTRWHDREGGWRMAERAPIHPPPDERQAIYQAMVLGLRDYVNKNKFSGVVLGLSGGIDSALSAAVAVDALGADRVHSVMMPSRYTSTESLEDAAACAKLLGTRLDTIEIEPAVDAFAGMLAPIFEDRPADTTEENIQSRIRGVTLMAISNKLGSMVLTTGNKSEMSVGYATLYGDMCGGYSVLKDVYKTTVFALCHWRNENHPEDCLGPEVSVIPERIITKPPSAELREDQKDEDSLPPYNVLDAVLHGLVEEDLSPKELVDAGFDTATVRRVSNLLDLAEYKRRQAPPGVKITRKAFGRDRRYPITNAFRRIGVGELNRLDPPE
ncbi:MAG: NAD+ synthase, partial [Pseudomonadota bacterium]